MSEPSSSTAAPSKAVATHTGSGLALDAGQDWWNERQKKGLEQLGLGQAGQGDLLVFFHVAQRTGLDPFARQIHMVSRNAKDENDRWVKKWTIQTGIDGFRLIADRADRREGTKREYLDTEWCDAEGNWSDVWLKVTAPTAAKVTILRDGRKFSHTVLFREYVQTKRNGDPTGMWNKMPANQLAKCAEAGALRKAYPQDLSGMYTDDEMGQADNVPAAAPGQTRGLGTVLTQDPPAADAPVEDDAIDGEVVSDTAAPAPGDQHAYVNDPETGACSVQLSDGSVCGELEDRPPHVAPAETAAAGS